MDQLAALGTFVRVVEAGCFSIAVRLLGIQKPTDGGEAFDECTIPIMFGVEQPKHLARNARNLQEVIAYVAISQIATIHLRAPTCLVNGRALRAGTQSCDCPLPRMIE